MKMYATLRILAIVALVVGALSCAYGCFTQEYIDTFYMVASGNWMLDNHAMQTSNISSPIPMGFVSQNWLFCLFAACCLRLFETLGINWYGMSLVSLVVLAAYAAFVIGIAYRMTDGSRAALILTVFLLVLFSRVTAFRPHTLVAALTIYCLWANRCYYDTCNWRPLVAVPLLTIAHSNIQSATALTEALVCLGYAATIFVFPPRMRRQSVVPLVAGIASCAAAFVNPYGLDAVLYALTNAGVDSYKNYVVEMGSTIALVMEGGFPYLAYIVIPGSLVLLSLRAQRHARRYHVAEDVMALAGICAVSLVVRNALYANLLTWWLCMVSWREIRSFLLARTGSASLDDLLALGSNKQRSIVTYLSYAFVLVMLCIGASPFIVHTPSEPTQTQRSSGLLTNIAAPTEVADYLLEDAGPTRRPHVLTSPEFGSYLEYRGCVVNCTSRWEIWEPGISGIDAHFFFDSADGFTRTSGDSDAALERLFAIDDWDYVLVGACLDYPSSKELLDHIESLGEFEAVFDEKLDGNNDAILYRRIGR